MGFGGGGGGGGGFPGMLSPFDINAAQTGQQQAMANMTARYNQLGLGQQGATPTSPGSFGQGSTAMQMDLGQLPSITGGIPAQFQALLGQLQTEDLAQTSALAESNLNQSSSNKSSGLSGISSVAGLIGK